MFSFTFQYPYGFLCAFIPALFNLGIIAYILFFLPRNRITNVFALLTLSCALWQLDDSVQRIIVDRDIVNFIDIIFCCGWIFTGPLCFHFAILHTKIFKARYSRIYLTLLYAPAFIFLCLYQMQSYVHIWQHSDTWGWVNFHNQNVIDIIQIYWISVLVLAALVLLSVYTFRIKNDELLKKQSLIITIGIAVPTITGIIAQVIFPTILHRPPVPVTATFMTALSVATLLALKKYKLFTVYDLINSEAVIDSMPIIVFSISKEKRITYMNHFGRQTLGLSKKNIAVININGLFFYTSEKDEQKLDHALQRTFEYGQSENIEASFHVPKGKIDVIISCTPIINNNQLEGALLTARDITELKKSHELIKNKEALLEEAQHLSHLGSWEWEISTNTIIWSDEMYRIYGYEPGETAALKSYSERVPYEEQEMIKDIIHQACVDHKPFTYYHRIKRKDKTEVIVYVQGKITVDENNRAVRMSGTTQDITELKRREEMLGKQNEELQKINTELDKFVYSVSHDLRAPLTSMLGVVEISREDAKDELMKERLDLLKTNIKKLDQFILDIMDYSRNAREEIVREEINFEQLLTEVTQNLKYMNGSNRAVDIRMNVNSNGIFRSDKSRLGIVLNNLISNSIRYNNPLQNEPFVEICVKASPKQADIIVKDNGIGIEKIYHDKIFEMFYRVSQSSLGSGLGLYLVKESLKKLNGEIKVESEKDQGSQFMISIPNN